MNPGEHETIVSNWYVVYKPDDGDYMEKRLTTIVEGCPYDFSIFVKLTRAQMQDQTDPNFSRVTFVQEMEAHDLMMDRTLHIKMLVMSNPVHDWTLDEWIYRAPFLFKDAGTGTPLDEEELDDEEMQKERDTWL